MFKIVSIDVTGIKEINDLLKAYSEAVGSKDINAKETDARQRVVETRINDVIGGKLVNGKIGQKQSADYLVPNNSSLIKLLYEEALQEGATPVEFKGASTSGGSTIGQITIGSQKNLYIPGQLDPFSATSIKQAILGQKKGAKEGYLVDLDPNLAKADDKSTYIFNTYFKKEPRLKKLFYAKASTILLGNVFHLNDLTGSRLIGLTIPEKYFTPAFFKAAIVDKAIVVSIRDNFQNKFIKELNEALLDEQKYVKGYKKSFKVGNKTYKIDYLPAIKGQQLFNMEITNSIKARPVDTFILKANVPTKQISKKDTTQQFISSAQWTALTQKRLGDTMSRFGEPKVPNLKERSGRFRASVQVTANYRANLLQFSYNPLYSSLQAYGYRPDLQVKRSIREVAQQLYGREFNIVKKAGI